MRPAVIENATDLSQALRARRKEFGLRQADLTGVYALSRFTLTDAESGRGDPKLSTLLRLFEGLGMRLVAVPAQFADRVSVPEEGSPQQTGRPIGEEDMEIDWGGAGS